MPDSELTAAVHRALAALDALLGPRGQWPGQARLDIDAQQVRSDLAPPLTALGMMALQDVPLPAAEQLLRRSQEHVELTVRPQGLWRYYANIPPDCDDSAMCALALGRDHPIVATRTIAALSATRRPDGLFPTWIEVGWDPAIDAVANAHVVAVIGPGRDTEAASAWLCAVVADGREVAETKFYPDPLDTHVAITRAVRRGGVEALTPAIAEAAPRALARLRAADGMPPYRRAQAIVVCNAARMIAPQSLDADVAPVMAQAADELLAQQRGDGTWESGCLFVAGNADGPGTWQFESVAVTTALCLAALFGVEMVDEARP